MPELDAVKKSVMSRLSCLESQGCLSVDGGSLAQYVALFDGLSPEETAEAVWTLIHEGALTYDESTNLVDRGKEASL